MSESFPCPCCQIGYCQPGKATYVRMHRGLLVSAQDVPAATCDICGYQEFDREAILRLEMLLGEADAPPDLPRPNPRAQVVETPDSRVTRRPKP